MSTPWLISAAGFSALMLAGPWNELGTVGVLIRMSLLVSVSLNLASLVLRFVQERSRM